MGNAARALLSAAVWHSWINADHWARAAASVAAGSGPAPIVFGSKMATIAASDPFPGPQVPPTAGLGRATRRPVIAKAAPKRPRMTSTSLVHHHVQLCVISREKKMRKQYALDPAKWSNKPKRLQSQPRVHTLPNVGKCQKLIHILAKKFFV